MTAYNHDAWLDQVTDSAWEALHPASGDDYTGGDAATVDTHSDAPSDTADTEAAADEQQYFETDVEGVYADEAGSFFEAGEDGLTPYEYDDDDDFTPPSDLEAAAFHSYLNREGVDFEHASAEVLTSALEFSQTFEGQLADNFSAKTLDQDMQAAMDEYIDAEDEASTDAQNWLDDLGADIDDVAPYINQANAAVAAGRVSEDQALDVAADAYRKATAATDVAERETKYRGLGFDKGMDAALSDVWSRSEGDRPKPYVPTPAKNAKGFSKAVGDATDRMLAQLTNRQNTLEAARKAQQRRGR